MTDEELKIFKELKDIQVVFDVGVRDSIDYVKIRPDAEYHFFEPNPFFYKKIRQKGFIPFRTIVHLNNYGLGDIEKLVEYDYTLESFKDSLAKPTMCDAPLQIRTLDGYTEAYGIKQIDFIKIDTEGYDLKVLQGGTKAIEMARYIQFETWDNLPEFEALLGDRFTFKDIGNRNVFCTRT